MVVLLAIAIAWLYAGTMAGLGGEWLSSPDASYGLVLAGVALLLVWQRREAIARAASVAASATSRLPRSGLALLAAGLLLYLVGQLGADIFLTRVSLVLVIAGVLAWSAAARSHSRGTAAKRAPLARGAAIVAMAVPVAIVMNGLRIAAVGIACELWDPRVTSGGWHTFTGWMTFVLSVAVMMQLQRVLAPRPMAAEREEGAIAA